MSILLISATGMYMTKTAVLINFFTGLALAVLGTSVLPVAFQLVDVSLTKKLAMVTSGLILGLSFLKVALDLGDNK